LEESRNGDVALLDLLSGHDLEEPTETQLAQPRRDRDGLRPELLVDDVRARSSSHRELARQALEEDEPPRVEVRAGRGRLAAELLGSGIAGRAHHLLRRREPG